LPSTITNLEADGALLAGLTHSIGLSTILVCAESSSELLNDNAELVKLREESPQSSAPKYSRSGVLVKH